MSLSSRSAAMSPVSVVLLTFAAAGVVDDGWWWVVSVSLLD